MTPTTRPSATLIVASLALVVSLGGTGYSATGGTFFLGKANSAGKTTKLKSDKSFDKATLEVKNRGQGPAVAFKTKNGVPPFTVKRDTKVANLNADRLDGLNSTDFLLSGSPVDADTLDGIGVDSFLRSDTAPLTVAVHNSSSVPVSSGVPLGLGADTEDYDPSDMHTGASNQLVAPRDGTYLVVATASIQAQASNAGYRSLTLTGTPAQFGRTLVAPAAHPAATFLNVTGIAHMSEGAFVRVDVTQSSGENLNATLTHFQMTYVGP